MLMFSAKMGDRNVVIACLPAEITEKASEFLAMPGKASPKLQGRYMKRQRESKEPEIETAILAEKNLLCIMTAVWPLLVWRSNMPWQCERATNVSTRGH